MQDLDVRALDEAELDQAAFDLRAGQAGRGDRDSIVSTRPAESARSLTQGLARSHVHR